MCFNQYILFSGYIMYLEMLVRTFLRLAKKPAIKWLFRPSVTISKLCWCAGLPAKQVLKDFVQLVPEPPATEVNVSLL